MKMSFPVLTAVLTAGCAGFAAGWFGKPDASRPPSRPGPVITGAPASPAARPVEQESDGREAAKVAAELKALKGLSNKEFAKSLADAWMAHGDPDSLLRKGLLMAACDAGKARSFYDEFKRRKGMASQQEGGQELREFLTMAGKRFGRELVTDLLKDHPEGLPDMDSLLHGWVSVEPDQAVEWLNGLPVDSTLYSNAVKGIVWGLGESSPATAVGVFLNLPPEERDSKLYWSLSSSAIRGHGIQGLTEVLAGIPDETERRMMLGSGMQYAMGEPPREFVQGLAGYVDSTPAIEGLFQMKAGQWADAAPSEAMDWLTKTGASTEVNAGSGSALRHLAGQLAVKGHAEALQAWVAANPQAPGRAAIEQALQNTPPQ